MMSLVRRLFFLGIFLPVISWMIFVYPWHRLFNYLPDSGSLNSLSIAALWLLPTSCFYIWMKTRSALSSILGLASVNWLGICLMFMWATVAADLSNLLFELPSHTLALQIVIGGSLLSLYSIYKASVFNTAYNSIQSDKILHPQKLVQISDLHLGSRSIRFLEKAISKTNEINPDMVFITGDLIDMSSVKPESLKVLKQLKAPSFFITGNHDRYIAKQEHFKAISQSGVTLLDDASVINNGLQIIGIADKNDSLQVEKVLPSIEINQSHFTILLYHKPQNFDFVARQNIDLMLSGHTHAGQIFPFQFFVKRQFHHFKGMLKIENSHFYVSQGTGTWGPIMRLGSSNEITVFELMPAAPAVS